MASLYQPSKSPYHWIKWRNPETKEVERFSTRLKVGDSRAGLRAINLKNEYALKESGAATNRRDHPFSEWVLDYLNAQHANSPRTLQRYASTWKTISAYFASIQISAPGEVRRDHCLAYVPWRRKIPHLNGRNPSAAKQVCMNTILMELKVLSKILFEAVVRQYIVANPCARLRLKKEKHREKHEMSDAQIEIILQRISKMKARAKTPNEIKNAEVLFYSFEIARFQGIRLSETCIALEDVDMANLEITLNAKGGLRYTTMLNPALVPLFKKLKAARKQFTYPPPARHSEHSLLWFKFFDKLRGEDASFKNISHHSGRVTVVSRMERAGAAEKAVMQLVNHASTTVHRVYRKIKSSELLPYWSAASPVISVSSGKPSNKKSPD